jgi:hypothetical protein
MVLLDITPNSVSLVPFADLNGRALWPGSRRTRPEERQKTQEVTCFVLSQLESILKLDCSTIDESIEYDCIAIKGCSSNC